MPSFGKYRKSLFNWRARGILKTPPLKCDPRSNVIVLSQTYDPDLTMYLVAAKSFGRFIKPREYVVVDDGLSRNNQDLLREHLGTVRFIRTQDIHVGLCPRGGMWERLITIANLCNDSYVVQLDSDTVTVDTPVEVQECIRANICFTLGTRLGRTRVSARDASDLALGMDSAHIQVLTERALISLPDAAHKFYIRGCAGFAGFSPNSIDFHSVQTFSQQMEALLGRATWSNWGSEQAASNYLIANTDTPTVLPFDKYPYWDQTKSLSQARLIHFIGGHRFSGREYIRRSQTAIKELMRPLD